MSRTSKTLTFLETAIKWLQFDNVRYQQFWSLATFEIDRNVIEIAEEFIRYAPFSQDDFAAVASDESGLVQDSVPCSMIFGSVSCLQTWPNRDNL